MTLEVDYKFTHTNPKNSYKKTLNVIIVNLFKNFSLRQIHILTKFVIYGKFPYIHAFILRITGFIYIDSLSRNFPLCV